jgi:hypothetical protein
MTQSKRYPTCSICSGPILPQGSWTQGNNAEPINSGRCCKHCDDTVVIPARLHRIAQDERRSNIASAAKAVGANSIYNEQIEGDLARKLDDDIGRAIKHYVQMCHTEDIDSVDMLSGIMSILTHRLISMANCANIPKHVVLEAVAELWTKHFNRAPSG